jgi:uncharacterized membrane protein
VTSTWRILGCAVGFGFGVVWMTVGIGPAILVFLCTALGFGAAFIAEQDRASLSRLRPSTETPRVEDEPLLRDEFEPDDYERHDADELPEAEIAPVGAGGDYGWPSPSS